MSNSRNKFSDKNQEAESKFENTANFAVWRLNLVLSNRIWDKDYYKAINFLRFPYLSRIFSK